MARETVDLKADRYLLEARLTITKVASNNVVEATCKGDGTAYTLGHDPHHGWHCSCPARGRCAHLVALGRVVTVH